MSPVRWCLRIVGRVVAGVVAAFPSTTIMLAVALIVRAGTPAAMSALVGLVLEAAPAT